MVIFSPTYIFFSKIGWQGRIVYPNQKKVTLALLYSKLKIKSKTTKCLIIVVFTFQPVFRFSWCCRWSVYNSCMKRWAWVSPWCVTALGFRGHGFDSRRSYEAVLVRPIRRGESQEHQIFPKITTLKGMRL